MRTGSFDPFLSDNGFRDGNRMKIAVGFSTHKTRCLSIT